MLARLHPSCFRHASVVLLPMPSGTRSRKNVSVYASYIGQVSHLLLPHGIESVLIGRTSIWIRLIEACSSFWASSGTSLSGCWIDTICSVYCPCGRRVKVDGNSDQPVATTTKNELVAQSPVTRYFTALVDTTLVFSPRTALRELCSCIDVYHPGGVSDQVGVWQRQLTQSRAQQLRIIVTRGLECIQLDIVR